MLLYKHNKTEKESKMEHDMWLATIEDDTQGYYEQRIFCSREQAAKYLESYYEDYVAGIPLSDWGFHDGESWAEKFEQYYTIYGDITLYMSHEDARGLYDEKIGYLKKKYSWD